MRIQCFQHKIDSIYFRSSRRTWKNSCTKHINLINGAGCLGLMCPHQWRSSSAGGTMLTGVIPRFMVEQELAPQRTNQTNRDGKHARTQTTYGRFVRRVIACPEDAVHWKRLCSKSLHGNSSDYTWNPSSYWIPTDFITHCWRCFNKLFFRTSCEKEHGNIWHVAQTPEAVNLLLYHPSLEQKLNALPQYGNQVLPPVSHWDSRTLQPARRADRTVHRRHCRKHRVQTVWQENHSLSVTAMTLQFTGIVFLCFRPYTPENRTKYLLSAHQKLFVTKEGRDFWREFQFQHPLHPQLRRL